MIIILARKNLDYASQAPLHPGYASCGPNDDHGLRYVRSEKLWAQLLSTLTSSSSVYGNADLPSHKRKSSLNCSAKRPLRRLSRPGRIID